VCEVEGGYVALHQHQAHFLDSVLVGHDAAHCPVCASAGDAASPLPAGRAWGGAGSRPTSLRAAFLRWPSGSAASGPTPAGARSTRSASSASADGAAADAADDALASVAAAAVAARASQLRAGTARRVDAISGWLRNISTVPEGFAPLLDALIEAGEEGGDAAADNDAVSSAGSATSQMDGDWQFVTGYDSSGFPLLAEGAHLELQCDEMERSWEVAHGGRPAVAAPSKRAQPRVGARHSLVQTKAPAPSGVGGARPASRAGRTGSVTAPAPGQADAAAAAGTQSAQQRMATPAKAAGAAAASAFRALMSPPPPSAPGGAAGSGAVQASARAGQRSSAGGTAAANRRSPSPVPQVTFAEFLGATDSKQVLLPRKGTDSTAAASDVGVLFANHPLLAQQQQQVPPSSEPGRPAGGAGTLPASPTTPMDRGAVAQLHSARHASASTAAAHRSPASSAASEPRSPDPGPAARADAQSPPADGRPPPAQPRSLAPSGREASITPASARYFGSLAKKAAAGLLAPPPAGATVTTAGSPPGGQRQAAAGAAASNTAAQAPAPKPEAAAGGSGAAAPYAAKKRD
jgi:hypothetical protein